MKKVINCIEIIVKIATVVIGIFTIVEVIKAWAYKRKLARKAQDYLEDEFIPEANIGTTINVYSPTIKENSNKVIAFLAATGAGCIILMICSIFKRERY